MNKKMKRESTTRSAFLSKKLKFFIKKCWRFGERRFLSIAIQSPFLSSVYYMLFSSKFAREQQSVLYGKYVFNKEKNSGIPNNSLLRRNLHRLEKGLCSPTPKPVFAVDYIEETVNAYQNALQNGTDQNTLEWAHDVLEKYFQTVEYVENVTNAFTLFQRSAVFSTSSHGFKKLPLRREDFTLSKIAYNDFWDLCQQRRSVRYYQDQQVPRELIEKAVEAALCSPSACNRQAFRFEVFDDPALLSNIVDLPVGSQTFAENIPVMVFLIGNLSAYFDERDRHLIYVDGGLVAMSFMYALETLGLGSCPIHWPDIEKDERRLQKMFGLYPYERCVLCISCGVPDRKGLIPYSQKKSVSSVLRFNYVHSNR